MAFLQPENIPSRNDLPTRLQAVARALRDLLPDQVTVWLERTGDGDTVALRREFDPRDGAPDRHDHDPYLVVLDPEAGIAVLEAPVVARSRRRLLRNSQLDAGVLREAVAQRAAALRRDCTTGPVRALPVVHVLAFPDTPRSDLPAERSLRMLSEEDFTPAALGPALRRIIGDRNRPLSRQEETAARATVNPSIVIGDPTQQGIMFRPPDDEAQLRALDHRQERLARHLGEGYRLIRGVAGSGKTLILTHRAAHFAEHFPRWRILLLCFNRALAFALAQEVKATKNVRAQTVDGLAQGLLRDAGRSPGEERKPDFEKRRVEALAIAPSLDDSKRYDMVLVDEAQDFGPSRLDLAWAMLKEDREHFVIALDTAQNVYRRRMTWNPPGMTARGRATVLPVNYRNTREILDLAQGALQGLDRATSRDPQSDSLDVMVMPQDALRTGEVPKSLACADLDAEARTIAAQVRELRESGTEPEHIIVLSGSKELRGRVLDEVPETLDVTQDRDGAVLALGKVRVATLHWSKGLEFRHVIVGGANNVWVPEDDETARMEQVRRLLYVAMTRATQTLTVTFSGEGPMNAFHALPLWDPEQSSLPPAANGR